MSRKSRFSGVRFHFLGIGGIGVCGIAEMFLNEGAVVTGSDLSTNANTERLSSLGIRVFNKHDRLNIGDADVVVYSSAIKDSNPEVQEAKRRKIPLIPRGEALAELMKLKRGIAVAGTHGKTTTTSMLGGIFDYAKKFPTIYVGGRIKKLKSTVQIGAGEWLIAESDESDNSFNRLSPEIAIITNVDQDHLDFFKSSENLHLAFSQFGDRVPFYGSLIVCGDDIHIRKIFHGYQKRITYYGFEPNNDVQITGENGDYKMFREKVLLGNFALKVPGRHNALNASAAILTALEAGIDFKTITEGLFEFEGVERRFHFKGEKNEILIYDDYAHHPTEIKATLQAFREKYTKKRLVVLFQPHRYSRTQSCWYDFLKCFQDADLVFVSDVYPAGEAPIPNVSADLLAQKIEHPNCRYANSPLADVKAVLEKGDVFITLGAGDNWKVGIDLLDGK